MSRMSRGLGLAVVGAVVVAAATSVWWWTASPDNGIPVDGDRNILLVTIDTLRADVLGSYGGRAATPNLDRLASTGARFDFAHAHAVVTLPSHASILSGRYPYEHGIRDNTGYRYPAGMPTIATLLGSQGFDTGAFVGGFPLDRRFGLNAGFDVYDDKLNAASAVDAADRERRADAVVSATLGWIGARQQKWFAWTHVYDPHVTYSAPEDWAARFPGDPYLAEVSWTDHALGPLFERLATLARPTLVIVTADHGESLGDHGEQTHGIFAYEPVLRVPLIVAEIAPRRGGRPAGTVVVRPVRHVDLLPTVLEFAGVSPPAGLSGTSLRPLLRGVDQGDRPSYFEAMTPAVARGWAPLRGVIVDRRKYIDLPIPELYDLAADPAETANLATEDQGTVRTMFNLLKGFNISPPQRAGAESAETIERLRSLGYVGGGTAAVKDRYTADDDPKRLIEIEQALTRATDAFRLGRTTEAAELYAAVIRKRPDTEDAYRKLALVHWRSGRPAAAIATLELALRNGVTQSEVRNKLAQYLAESGQPGKAIALLEADPGEDPDALIALGNAYAMTGRLAEAARAFRQLIALEPSIALAHENLGAVQLQSGDHAGAEASLRKAIELDPQLAGAHTALGVVLAGTGRTDEAIGAWKRAVEIEPSDLNALFNLTLKLVEAGRREEAQAFGERFLAVAPPGMRRDADTVRRAIGR